MRIILLLIFVCVFQLMNAQQIYSEVIGNSGDHFSNASSSVSWTVGEPFIETYSNTSNVLTQGFHQTKLTVSSFMQDENKKYDIHVFPNPVNYLLTVSTEKDRIDYKLIDSNGKIISEGKTGSIHYQIDFSKRRSGLYFLEIAGIKTFKIIKQ